MGQYYRICNLDKKEYVNPSGVKLMEHAWFNCGTMKKVEDLLKKGGRWYKDRLVWAGDYANEDFITANESDLFDNLSALASYEYIKVVIDKNVDDVCYRFIVNETKKEFVDKEKCPISEDGDENGDWIVHPLPVLAASGNGRGGGDYMPIDENKDGTFVGIWAGDAFYVTDDRPNEEEYFEITPNFKEEW